MDYLSVICAPAVAARHQQGVEGFNWYYHGSCVTTAQYKMLTSTQELGDGSRSPALVFERWRPGDSVVDADTKNSRPCCDKCRAPLEDLPC